MKQHPCIPHRRVRSSLCVTGVLAIFALGANAWAANDLDTPAPRHSTGLNGADTFNAEWVGHNDLQGRVTYQTTVHNYPDGRVIAFAGHFNGLMLNPQTGVVERNGTSIVDVTNPRRPVYLKHVIADKGGARMNMICDGGVLPHGTPRH